MKKVVILVITIILAIMTYFVIINYGSFDIQTQNDIKIGGFGLLLGISFIVISYLSNKNAKKNREIIRSILILDLYILGNFFLKDNLNLNGSEFAIFFIFLLLLILTSYIKHRIKGIIGLILGIGILFFLLKSVFPDFEINPNEISIDRIQNKLVIQTSEKPETLSLNNTKIIIESTKNTKSIDILGNLESSININDIKKISFLSKNDKIHAKIYITIGKDILYLNPQSSINFQYSGAKTIINSDSIKGKVGIYQNSTSNIIIDGNIISNDPQNIEEVKKLQDNKSLLISQYGGFLIENQTTRKISKLLLDISFYVFPSQYKNNIENYNSVIKLLGIGDISDNYKDSQAGTGTQKSFFNQIKKGYGKTYLKLF